MVDASVAVKWLVDEAYSENAARLLNDGLTLVAPELLYAEVANALWALCRRGDIGAPNVAEALETMKGAPIAVPSSLRQLAAAAGRLAMDLDHSVYDCFYLALAIQEQYPVVTADARFHTKVQDHPYLSDRILHVANVLS